MSKKNTGLAIIFGAVLGALSVAGISFCLKSKRDKKALAEEDIELTEIDLEPGDPSQDIPGRTYITLVSGSEDEETEDKDDSDDIEVDFVEADGEKPVTVKISTVTVEEDLDGESA